MAIDLSEIRPQKCPADESTQKTLSPPYSKQEFDSPSKESNEPKNPTNLESNSTRRRESQHSSSTINFEEESSEFTDDSELSLNAWSMFATTSTRVEVCFRFFVFLLFLTNLI